MQSIETQDFWKKCSSCKKPIFYSQKYWVCNVSTCNRKRTGLSFCSVSCWDAHGPMMNHRESWAEERKAPTLSEWQAILAEEAMPKKRTPREKSESSSDETTERKAVTPPVVLRRSRAE